MFYLLGINTIFITTLLIIERIVKGQVDHLSFLSASLNRWYLDLSLDISQSILFVFKLLYLWIFAGFIVSVLEMIFERKYIFRFVHVLRRSFFLLPLFFVLQLAHNLLFEFLYLNNSLSIFLGLVIETIIFVIAASLSVIVIGGQAKFKEFLKLFGTAEFLVLVFSISTITLTNKALTVSTLDILLKTLLFFILLNRFRKKELRSKKKLVIYSPLWAGNLGALSSVFLGSYPPFAIVLAALSVDEYEVIIDNGLGLALPLLEEGDICAISCFSSNSYRAYKVAKHARKRKAYVAMGGPHVSACPDEALNYADTIFIGEAEEVWKAFLNDLSVFNPKAVYCGQATESFSDLTLNYYKSLDATDLVGTIETSRGCKYNCDFCAIPVIFKNKLRKAKLDTVMAQIDKLSAKIKHLAFLDNNIYAMPQHSRTLFKALKGRGLTWESGSSIDIAKNEEDLLLAKESGAKRLLIGYEIVQEDKSRAQGAKFNYLDEYVKLSTKIKKAGINIKASFIFGYDNDSFMYMLKMLLTIARINPQIAALAFVTPLPGTRLYDNYLEKNRIFNLNWKNYNLRTIVVWQGYQRKLRSIMFNILRFSAFFFFSDIGRALFFVLFLYFLYAKSYFIPR